MLGSVRRLSIMFRVRSIASVLTRPLLFGFVLSACSSSSKSSTSAEPDASTPTMNVGCASEAADSYAPGMKKVGDAGLYNFELLSSTPAPPALNDNTFMVQVTDTDGNPVAGTLSVALDMPEHGHPSPAQPEITYDGRANAFTLDPMRLFMVGLWRLTFSFQPDAGVGSDPDSAVFKFCID